MAPYGNIDLGPHGSGNGLSDGTKPLFKPILTYHHWGSVTITRGKFLWNFLSHQSLNWDWKLVNYYLKLPVYLPVANELNKKQFGKWCWYIERSGIYVAVNYSCVWHVKSRVTDKPWAFWIIMIQVTCMIIDVMKWIYSFSIIYLVICHQMGWCHEVNLFYQLYI